MDTIDTPRGRTPTGDGSQSNGAPGSDGGAPRTTSPWQVLAEGVTLFVLGAAPVVALLDGLDVVTGSPVEVEIGLDAGTTLDVGQQAVPVDSAFAMLEPTSSQAWIIAGTGVVQALIVSALAWIVYSILRDARTAPGPFGGDTSARLFRLAVLGAVGGIVLAALDWVAPMLLTPTGAGLVAQLSLVPIGLAAFVGVMAEVFRRGEAMQDDLSGLV